jgi:type I site-specific restriction-modification system R (restriction) subunit
LTTINVKRKNKSTIDQQKSSPSHQGSQQQHSEVLMLGSHQQRVVERYADYCIMHSMGSGKTITGLMLAQNFMLPLI